MFALHSRLIKAISALFIAVSYPVLSQSDSVEDTEKLEQSFIQQMLDDHQIPAEKTTLLLQNANKNQSILDAISRPWESKPWFKYHPIFLTDSRLQKGLAFWQKHQTALVRAEKEFGVPAEIIVSIIGIETNYGSYLGKYSVLDALYTLGFHYPPRADFFRSELAQYMLLVEEEKFDPTQLKGSYAGAMGYGQFISSSYRNYAVDFDNDGKRDILTNPIDAIGSVANYFHQHKWQTNEDVIVRAKLSGTQYSSLLSDDLTYQHTWSELQDKGIRLTNSADFDKNQSSKLFSFETEHGYEYWVGLPNFYVITRYNHSPLYAMVIYQFSQQLKQQRAE